MVPYITPLRNLGYSSSRLEELIQGRLLKCPDAFSNSVLEDGLCRIGYWECVLTSEGS